MINDISNAFIAYHILNLICYGHVYLLELYVPARLRDMRTRRAHSVTAYTVLINKNSANLDIMKNIVQLNGYYLMLARNFT